jgi:hypothetical protein
MPGVNLMRARAGAAAVAVVALATACSSSQTVVVATTPVYSATPTAPAGVGVPAPCAPGPITKSINSFLAATHQKVYALGDSRCSGPDAYAFASVLSTGITGAAGTPSTQVQGFYLASHSGQWVASELAAACTNNVLPPQLAARACHHS